MTPEQIIAAQIEVARLTHELDITNADHIALWLDANIGPSPIDWLACRIIEAHEAILTAREASVVKGWETRYNIIEAELTANERMIDGLNAEIERNEGLAKVYRRAQLTAEEKLCREHQNATGWKKRAERLEVRIASARAEGRREGIEEAAKVAGIYASDGGLEPAEGWSDEHSGWWECGVIDAALAIKSAIRTLAEKRP